MATTMKKSKTKTKSKTTVSRKKARAKPTATKRSRRKTTETAAKKLVATPFDTPAGITPEGIVRDTGAAWSQVDEISSGISGLSNGFHPSREATSQPTATEGEVEISRQLLARIVSCAIEEVEGLARARSDGSSKLVNVLQGRINGIRVDRGNSEAAVDMLVRIQYGENIPELAARLRETVGRRIWEMTGLRVVEVNVRVQDIVPANQPE